MITQEKLSENEAIDLLILPDMDIDIPIKALMSIICYIMVHANFPDSDLKTDIILCEIMQLNRFITKYKLSEMVNMLKLERENPEIMRIISKYGQGFDTIYFDGKQNGKLEDAKNFLAEGVDEKIIIRCTGISINQLKDLKRKH